MVYIVFLALEKHSDELVDPSIHPWGAMTSPPNRFPVIDLRLNYALMISTFRNEMFSLKDAM